MSAPQLPERPLSPHAQIWRWHPAMVCSFTHRISLFGLYLGALMLAGWVYALAGGEQTYLAYGRLLASAVGRIALFGVTAAVWYNIAFIVRTTFNDLGKGLSPRTGNITAWAVFLFTGAATLATWLYLGLSGRLG